LRTQMLEMSTASPLFRSSVRSACYICRTEDSSNLYAQVAFIYILSSSKSEPFSSCILQQAHWSFFD